MRSPSDLHGGARFAMLVAMLLVVYAISTVLSYETAAGLALLFSIVVVPFALGLATEWLFGRRAGQSTLRLTGIAIAAHLIAVGLILLTGNETAICLAMALPIHAVVVPLTIWFVRRPGPGGTANASLWLLPVAMVALDILPVQPKRDHSVTTDVLIAAPPDVVWRHVASIAPIVSTEHAWTVSHNLLGMPRPVEARLDGSVRRARWTGGITFEENVIEQTVGASVEWTFAFPDPVSLAAIDTRVRPGEGMVDLLGGGYRIEPTIVGSRLVLRTDYRLTSFAQTYVSAWGRLFLTDIHSAVLHVVKSRAEAAKKEPQS